MPVSKNQGPSFGSPDNKNHSVLGSSSGPYVYGNPQACQNNGRTQSAEVDAEADVVHRISASDLCSAASASKGAQYGLLRNIPSKQ